MLIKSLAALALFATVSAQSAVVLALKASNESCVVKEGEVSRTFKLDGGKLSFTTVKKISTTGLESYARKAMAQATEQEVDTFGISHQVEVDGVGAPIQFKDSMEARMLISFISEACK